MDKIVRPRQVIYWPDLLIRRRRRRRRHGRPLKRLLRGYIQKFPDWVIKKYTLSFRISRWKTTQRVMAAKFTRQTDWLTKQRYSDRELYHLQFSLQAASPETFGYALVDGYNREAETGHLLAWLRDQKTLIPRECSLVLKHIPFLRTPTWSTRRNSAVEWDICVIEFWWRNH